jgi:FKBP-type peptidyl-prolyl cis-trans isomerase 2
MTLQKNDFIEIDFTGKIKDTGEIFDSNIKEDLAKSNLENSEKLVKPFVFALGQGMFLPGIEDYLIGKSDKPEKYTISLAPEKAFGLRDQKLIQIMPLKLFYEHKLNPIPGVMFNFDGRVAKVLSVSGGRVRVDFNHPIAGKEVVYDVKINKKIEDLNEKIKHFMDFLFRKDFKFNIEGNKIMIDVEKPFAKFVELFADKCKEVVNLELQVKEIEADLKKVKNKKEEKESE